MGRQVTVQYYKYSDAVHWRHELVWLGEDAHGTWLAGPVGTVVQRGSEPPVQMRRAFVQLITPDRWWTALFNGPGDGNDMPVYVDVTTVARRVGDERVELVDLDLDVVQRRDGSVYVDDEDEFEDHRVIFGYPESMVASARGAAARLVLDIQKGAPPFDGTGAAWLGRIL
ncbi:MAG TPA: DUF402 domain-containing protein [Acidimicrobiia bacterium]|nr:DUF402 domain-containing protein [Acidimicrobiia bacterium]